MKRLGILGLLAFSSPAWAGASTAFSYGMAAVPKNDTVAPESVATLRTTILPDNGPVGMGLSLRAHGGPQGFDIGVTPDLCVGRISDDFSAHLCGGLTVYNFAFREQVPVHSVLSPVVEPSIGIPIAEGEAGAFFISAPMGYDNRFGQDGNFWAGITVGFGGFSGF